MHSPLHVPWIQPWSQIQLLSNNQGQSLITDSFVFYLKLGITIVTSESLLTTSTFGLHVVVLQPMLYDLSHPPTASMYMTVYPHKSPPRKHVPRPVELNYAHCQSWKHKLIGQGKVALPLTRARNLTQCR